jgi:archaellum biogenesis ATPase FlaH
MLDRDAYDMIVLSGEMEHLDDALVPIWLGIQVYYARDPDVGQVDIDVLQAQIEGGVHDPKRRELVSRILDELSVVPVSPANCRAFLEEAARSRVGDALSAALAVRKPKEEVHKLIESYQELDIVYAEKVPVTMDWAGLLVTRADKAHALQVTPKALNEALGGGVLPGHNLTIFGRPEAGKSALAISMACGFARRGHKVLYLGNEDPVQDMAVRALSNLTEVTAAEMACHPIVYQDLGLARGAGNLMFMDICPGTLAEVERLVKIRRPAVLIVDQLRNLTGAKSENYTNVLDRSAQGIRAIGKRYGLVTISVTQAGDSGRGKPYLNDGDVDSSNTGIPGAADVLIGIGVTEDMEAAGIRGISLCKNKLTGRHDKFEVRISTVLSKVTSK